MFRYGFFRGPFRDSGDNLFCRLHPALALLLCPAHPVALLALPVLLPALLGVRVQAVGRALAYAAAFPAAGLRAIMVTVIAAFTENDLVIALLAGEDATLRTHPLSPGRGRPGRRTAWKRVGTRSQSPAAPDQDPLHERTGNSRPDRAAGASPVSGSGRRGRRRGNPAHARIVIANQGVSLSLTPITICHSRRTGEKQSELHPTGNSSPPIGGAE